MPRLLPSQKLAVMNVIVQAGLPPAEFQWGDLGTTTKLTHVSSQYSIAFMDTGVAYSPGSEHQSSASIVTGWQSQLQVATSWVTYLKRELNALDLLTAFSTQSAFFTHMPTNAQSAVPFTQAEREQLRGELKILQDKVLNELEAAGAIPAGSAQQVKKTFEENFEYLTNALDRVGRVDWKNLMLTTAISISITAAFAPDIRQEVFRLLLEYFYRMMVSNNLLT